MRKPVIKPVTIALCLLLALSACPALAEPTPLALADLSVNAVYAGATPETVRAAFGNPASSDTSDEAATGNTKETWQYSGLTFTFTNGTLNAAEWTDVRLTGPRGLRIGDSKDTVITAFYRDTSQTDSDVLYTAGWVEAFEAQLPPCGTVRHPSDGVTEILYRCPVEPYPADVQSDPTLFVYQTHASLSFLLDSATDAVTTIRWDVEPLAE